MDPTQITPAELAAYFDHTLLAAHATDEEIIALCNQAKEYSFASVCVNPLYVSLAAKELSDSPVKVCSVIGFPLGNHLSAIKAQETEQAIIDGAVEIDMVIPVGQALAQQYDRVQADIQAVLDACRAAKPEPAALKVILETAALPEDVKIELCRRCSDMKVDFVKTSTGFHKAGGATLADVKLMREHAPNCKVKASGGIRDLETTLAMIAAGADRIGASAGVAIMAELAAAR